jgi:hypothetical protein
MKRYYVNKLQLWPRFRPEVKLDLDKAQNFRVLETSIVMSKSMRIIEELLFDLMNIALSELKKQLKDFNVGNKL